MADQTQVIDASHDALLEMLGVLFKASNQTTKKSEFLKLKSKREEIMEELDRIELAHINEDLPPAEVQKAVNDLRELTDSLIQERQRIKKATEKLKKADEYLTTATDVLKLIGKVLAFV
jgi:uncharacterized coiled-coil DUF342 family protein